MSARSLRSFATVLLVLAVGIQLGSIASPGWEVDVKGNLEVYSGIFYYTVCDRGYRAANTSGVVEACESQTFNEKYVEDIKLAGQNRPLETELETSYNKLIFKQTGVLFALVLTMLAALTSVCARRCSCVDYSSEGLSKRAISVSMMFVGIACGVMIYLISGDLVSLINLMNWQSLDGDRDHTYMAIPYSMLMYLGAILLMLLALVMLMKQNCWVRFDGSKRLVEEPAPTPAPQIKRSSIDKPKVEMVTTTKVAVPPHSTKVMVGKDNPVFYSEKL